MKKLICMLLTVFFTLGCFAQTDTPNTREQKKSARKEQREHEKMMLKQNTGQAIRSGFFILKADMLRGPRGYSIHVNPVTNFIYLLGEEVYVQLGPETGVGYKGFGGLTLKSHVSDMTVERDKNNGYVIQLLATGDGGAITIIMHVNETGDMARATVSTNWGSRIDFDGNVVPARPEMIKNKALSETK